MEGHCSTGQSPQWAVVPMEEEEVEEEEEEEEEMTNRATYIVVDMTTGMEGPGFDIRRR